MIIAALIAILVLAIAGFLTHYDVTVMGGLSTCEEPFYLFDFEVKKKDWFIEELEKRKREAVIEQRKADAFTKALQR